MCANSCGLVANLYSLFVPFLASLSACSFPDILTCALILLIEVG